MLTTTYGLLLAGMSRIGRAATGRGGGALQAGRMAAAAAAQAGAPADSPAGLRRGHRPPPDVPARPAREHLRLQIAADLREAGTIPPLDPARRPLVLRDPLGTGCDDGKRS